MGWGSKAGNQYIVPNTDTNSITPTKILLSESISRKRYWPDTDIGTNTDTRSKHKKVQTNAYLF